VAGQRRGGEEDARAGRLCDWDLASAGGWVRAKRGGRGRQEERIRIDGQDQEKNIPSLCPVLLFCCEPSQPFISKAPIAAASFLSFFLSFIN